MKQYLLAFLFLLSCTLGYSQSQDHLFILDGSGSMWQKLNRAYKINTAREVLKDIYKALPLGARAGLIVYGHNNESDCEDIENTIPIIPTDTILFFEALDNINPVGLTPIAASLELALEIISSKSTPTTVILISDGLETCGGNACDVVKKAKENGYNIVSHVIGFGLRDDEDQSPLECIAQVGGGQYFSANSAEELMASLTQSIEMDVVRGGQLSIHVKQQDQPIDALIKIYKKGEHKIFALGRSYISTETNPRIFNLPIGDYEAEISPLKIDGNPIQKITHLQITKNDTLSHIIDFSAGEISIKVTGNGELIDALITIKSMKEGKIINSGRSYLSESSNPRLFSMAPNTFNIEIKPLTIEGNPTHIFENVILKSGEKLNFAYNFKSGKVKVSAKQNGHFIDAVISIKHPITDKEIAKGRTYANAKIKSKTFTISPGNYRISIASLNQKSSAKSILIKVSANRMVELNEEW